MIESSDFRNPDRGSSVARKKEPEVEAPAEVSAVEPEEATAVGLPSYLVEKPLRITREPEGKPVINPDGPEFSNQMTHPLCQGTFKKGPLKVSQFDLSKQLDLTTYNELLEKTEPEGAPRVVIDLAAPMQGPNGFIVMVRYREITYFKVIK